jgi:site-specific recombinase
MMKLQVETQDLSEKFDGVKHELRISLSQRRAADHELHERESKVICHFISRHNIFICLIDTDFPARETFENDEVSRSPAKAKAI